MEKVNINFVMEANTKVNLQKAESKEEEGLKLLNRIQFFRDHFWIIKSKEEE